MRMPSPQTRKLAAPDWLWMVSIRIARHDATAAAAVMLLAAGLWWAFVEVGSGSGPLPAKRSPLAIRWMPSAPSETAHAWMEDVRGVSSPVLFALPTPIGFSRGQLQWDAPALSMDAVSGDPALPSSAWPIQSLARLDPPTLAETIRLARRLDRPRVDGTPELVLPGPTGAVLVVVWERIDGVSRTLTVPVSSGSVWVADGPWEARAQVRVDGEGWPQHILLEDTGAGRNRETQLVQMLRQMNFGASTARDGSLYVRYEGAGSGGAR